MKSAKSKIEFCKKCGSIMLPEKKAKNVYLKCRKCGYEVKKGIRDLRITQEENAKKAVVVIEKDTALLPITDRACEKCRHGKAYYWLQQTRSADEPPTQFFRCVKCRHVWREYK